jgi:hypothetical protein
MARDIETRILQAWFVGVVDRQCTGDTDKRG